MYIKKIFFLLFIFILTSCSKISGRYIHYTQGYLGMDNSVSSYDFGSFGTVKYSLSTSGKISQNIYNKTSGKFSIKDNNIIINFGGSDRVLTISSDRKTLTDNQGTVYTKE